MKLQNVFRCVVRLHVFPPFLKREFTLWLPVCLCGRFTPSRLGQVLMVRICSKRGKFFPFGDGSHLGGAEMEVEKLLSL